jgi:hypothetical protein
VALCSMYTWALTFENWCQWDLVGGPTCLAKLVEEAKALLQFMAREAAWPAALSSTYEYTGKTSRPPSRAASLDAARSTATTRPSSAAATRPLSGLSRPASSKSRPVSATGTGSSWEMGWASMGNRPPRPWSAAASSLAPMQHERVAKSTHPMAAMSGSEAAIRVPTRPASALGLTRQSFGGMRPGERERERIESDGKDIERRVLLRCNQPSMSNKDSNGLGTSEAAVQAGGWQGGGAPTWQPMCATLAELEGTATEDSSISFNVSKSLSSEYGSGGRAMFSTSGARGEKTSAGAVRPRSTSTLLRRPGYGGGMMGTAGTYGHGAQALDASQKCTFGSGHVGRIRAASAGRKRPDELDSAAESDALTYHAVRMESATVKKSHKSFT